jgi:hypothetical protein
VITEARRTLEILELETIYSLPSDGEETMLENDAEVLRLLDAAIKDQEIILARRGRSGGFCFCCGEDAPRSICACQFENDFGCTGERLCTICRDAHHAVAAYVAKMFSAERTEDFDSVQYKKYNLLCRCAMELAERNNPIHKSQELYDSLNTTADPLWDDATEFVANTLAAFKKVRFLDFQALAREITKREDRMLHRMMEKAFAKPVRTRSPEQTRRLELDKVLRKTIAKHPGAFADKTLAEGCYECESGRCKIHPRSRAQARESFKADQRAAFSGADPDVLSHYLNFRDGKR